jgi:hypothetical protein
MVFVRVEREGGGGHSEDASQVCSFDDRMDGGVIDSDWDPGQRQMTLKTAGVCVEGNCAYPSSIH